MRLKGKSKSVVAVAFALGLLMACTDDKIASEEAKRESDSLRKIRQRAYSDSMKRTNPMLIMPPDSDYTGDYIDKYPSGIIKFKGMFRFGQRHGDWFSFYPNGEKWSELSYDNGLKTGKNVAYYSNGKIRFEGYYKNDIQDSLWIYYDTTGKIMDSFTLKNGKLISKN